MGMQVSNPDQFLTDPAALQAVKATIAEIAGVPVSTVTDVQMLSTSGASGNIQVVYTIDAPDGNANEIAQKINSSDLATDSKILSEQIAAAGISATYPETTVVSIDAKPGPTPAPTPAPNPCDTTANPCGTTMAAGPTPG